MDKQAPLPIAILTLSPCLDVSYEFSSLVPDQKVRADHTRWQGADFQEFMVAPYGASSFREALEWGSEIYHALRTMLMEGGTGSESATRGVFYWNLLIKALQIRVDAVVGRINGYKSLYTGSTGGKKV